MKYEAKNTREAKEFASMYKQLHPRENVYMSGTTVTAKKQPTHHKEPDPLDFLG